MAHQSVAFATSNWDDVVYCVTQFSFFIHESYDIVPKASKYKNFKFLHKVAFDLREFLVL